MNATTSSGPDVIVVNQGSIFLFHLHTQAAKAWVSQNVEDGAQYFGGALVVEHRYARDLVARMLADGLLVT